MEAPGAKGFRLGVNHHVKKGQWWESLCALIFSQTIHLKVSSENNEDLVTDQNPPNAMLFDK
jgi:hypothetical protein